MPELPEVENLRRGLERVIVGQKITFAKVTKPKLVSGKGTLRVASSKKVKEFIKGLKGETFSHVERRAKNLIFRFKSGKVLLGHLKMSGQFAYVPKVSDRKKVVMGGHPIKISESELPNKHSHIIFELEKGTLYYNDTRMFGYLLYYPSVEAFEAENHFKLIGPEPLEKDFTVEYFKNALASKKSIIKSVLMGQEIVAGLGNIYVDESLFEAKIKPTRTASSLSLPEIKLLHTAIIRIIRKAVELGGSSVATYRLLDMTRGNYAREHKVYGKDGQKCVRCGKPLKKILIQTRTTIFCPNCQK
ncbi:MAG: DNA-formamidopyrimidine glycosylase [bacterium]